MYMYHYEAEEIKPSAGKKRHFPWESTYLALKVIIGDTIFSSPTGEGTALLHSHPSHAQV